MNSVIKATQSGTWSSGSITVSELPYYNLFLITSKTATTPLIGMRGMYNDQNQLRFIGGYYNWGVPYFYVVSLQITNNTSLSIISSSGIIERRLDNGTTVTSAIESIYGIL